MSKVTIINLNEYVNDETHGEYKIHGAATMAVITGPKGIILTDSNGYHTSHQTPANEIDVQLPVSKNSGELNAFPEGMGQETLDKLLAHSSTTEQNLSDFIELTANNTSSRAQLLDNSIREIGANPDDED
jgi:hypothetical protein